MAAKTAFNKLIVAQMLFDKMNRMSESKRITWELN
jgi:hypothetical protein